MRRRSRRHESGKRGVHRPLLIDLRKTKWTPALAGVQNLAHGWQPLPPGCGAEREYDVLCDYFVASAGAAFLQQGLSQQDLHLRQLLQPIGAHRIAAADKQIRARCTLRMKRRIEFAPSKFGSDDD